MPRSSIIRPKYDEIKADESSDGYSKDYVILSAKDFHRG